MSIDTELLALKIRRHAIEMTHRGQSSHIASILSMADILAVLYGDTMNFRSNEPQWSERDRFILSKGHAGAGVYATLAELGFFSVSKLNTHYQDGSDLSGHVSHKRIPGVEFSTGSLGHGLPVCVGMAKAAKLDQRRHNVYCLMSDGECDEGSNWEAALFAAHHNLNNLIAIIDYNKLQSLGSVSDTLGLEPFADKWRSFGWLVHEIDGHDHTQLKSVLKPDVPHSTMPKCVIAHTTKGKGVTFMENAVLWHYRHPAGEEYQNACSELDNRLDDYA